MKRRGFFTAAAIGAATLRVGPLYAQSAEVTLAEVQALFQSRDLGARRMVQDSLKHEGYYTGRLMARGGRGPQRAFARSWPPTATSATRRHGLSPMRYRSAKRCFS